MTAQERYQALKKAFLEARALDAEALGPYLDQACGGDLGLRRDVERLLAAHNADGGGVLTAREGAEPSETEFAEQTAALDSEAGRASRPAAFPGYRVVRQLDRGGQGVVYEAVQSSTKRKVAIKVLVEGPHASKAARARFEREIELAAHLAHPDIVTIFDSGVSTEGQRYYAMDYVRGVPLNEFVRGKALTLEETLRLFSRVCEAVQYAHQRGIIHRDLKPSNVLVNVEGDPKILDFGLAKRLSATAETLATISQQVLGTLPYMSPEQTRGNPDEIDTRSDVYSLGVMLYELLTGHPPYPVVGPMADVLRHIAETPPAPPDQRWSGDSGVTRRSGSRTRTRKCPIDSEVRTIVLKTLAKERDRRYASAGELARDIQRYLRGEPIGARRESGWYLLRKTVRRYRTAVAAVAAFVVLVTSSAIALSIVVAKLHAARFSEAVGLVDGAYERLVYTDWRKVDLPQLAEVLDHAERVGVDATRIAMTWALANVGVKNSEVAVERLESARQAQPENTELLYLLAWAHCENGELDDAYRHFDTAERLGGPGTAAAWFFRGLTVHRDDPAAAIDSYRRAIRMRDPAKGSFPQAVLHLARAHNQRMYSTRQLESFEESEASLSYLIKNEQRGAYPHYLLSVAHRLAAEIIAEREGAKDERVAEHYQAALDWARRGQAVNADEDRPITAEAECFESMGRFDEAIEARTRAFKVADARVSRYEALHYRWRLYYWTNQPEAALADLDRIVADFAHTKAELRFYEHVYPALVHAERGESDEAVRLVLTLIDEQDIAALDALWAATGLRLLGRADQASRVLAEWGRQADYSVELVKPQTEQWMRQLYAFCAGGDPLEDLLIAANRADDPRKLIGEVHFHAAAISLGEGDRSAARRNLEAAYRSFDGEERYTYQAKIVLQKLRLDPDWPAWIPVAADVSAGDAERDPD